MKLFFDGGCQPNPGMMEIAVVVRGQAFVKHGIGHGSNNDAEWLALLHALEVAGQLGLRDIQLLGDSAAVIAQANGVKSRSASLRPYAALFTAAAQAFSRVRVRRIGRAQNLAGIVLEQARRNRALTP